MKLTLIVPFLGCISLQTRTKLRKSLMKLLHCCEITFIFKTDRRLCSIFRFKDRVPKDVMSNVVYGYKCGGCNAIYYGQTTRHLKIRSAEHIGVSALTGKPIKIQRGAISDHHSTCTHKPSFDDFRVLSGGGSEYLLKVKESLFIMKDNPPLNRMISSEPLYLFDKL